MSCEYNCQAAAARLIRDAEHIAGPSVHERPPDFDRCFVRGTLVKVKGGLKNIEDILPGDLVLSWNEAKKAFEYRPVTHLITGKRQDIVELHGEGWSVECSSNHPFLMSDGSWKQAAEITEGDLLHANARNPKRVRDVRPKSHVAGQMIEVFNFEVEGTHTYCVTEAELVVHNMKW